MCVCVCACTYKQTTKTSSRAAFKPLTIYQLFIGDSILILLSACLALRRPNRASMLILKAELSPNTQATYPSESTPPTKAQHIMPQIPNTALKMHPRHFH